MFITTQWTIMDIIGLIIIFVGAILGGFLGMMFSIMICTIGGLIMFFPVMMAGATIKRKRLVPFFMQLKPNEQISLFVNNRFQMHPFIFNTKHEGIMQKKHLGIIEDKGSPLTWGSQPISISLQGLGVTLDLKKGSYQKILEKNRGIKSYEEAIMRYLGPAKYTEFYNLFRKNPRPDIYHIRKELLYLIARHEPNDPLSEEVLGETITFKDYAKWLVYVYNPTSAQNAMDAEKIQAKREAMAYKEQDKATSIGKAIVMIIITIMIFLIVMGATGGLSFLGF